ncbi:2,3-bisphosphoglycerate-independent phosphoglycerate mutase [bacterium]|jgi:2,3-bisphosphoglycerate-independent phosphoglycerate mutase|nr:2,3-bisphosphoglycerate-independent phosphoglycerate mutase [bacterium]MBT6293245.1 2,3-bisphosphoglycerate-independent phosphoglycerate mutase [bacterium]
MKSDKALLIIIDGYGIAKDADDNAVTRSNSPHLKNLLKNNPTTIEASGKAVGLPENTVGNSEVGHFTIGCGQILDQALVRINKSIETKKFFEINLLKDQINKTKNAESNIHITCLLSDTGIHGQIKHLKAVCELLKQEKIKNFYFHGVLDGRDVPQKSAEKYINQTINLFKEEKIGTLASLCGRFYAMDRDNNYERTKVFYDLVTNSEEIKKTDEAKLLTEIYKEAENDYYAKAYKISDFPSLKDSDLFINMNYRTDRQEQITQALENLNFSEFKADIKPNLITFGDYGSKKFNIFPTPEIKENLSSVLNNANYKQARIAETEKFAHVTFFFNSQNKQKSQLEEHFLIPSSKVANYKDDPTMQASKITEKAIEVLKSDYKLIVINYANPDLVGHSGNFEATKIGIECIDKNLKKLIPKALNENYTIIIIADHGNAEDMKHEDGSQNPSHTTNQVPFIVVSNKNYQTKKVKDAGLKDIAPTILDILDLKIPNSFHGSSLIEELN